MDAIAVDELADAQACQLLHFVVERRAAHGQGIGHLRRVEGRVGIARLDRRPEFAHKLLVGIADGGLAGRRRQWVVLIFLPKEFAAAQLRFNHRHEQLYVKRFGDVGIGAELVANLLALGIALRREQHHGNVADFDILFDGLAKLIAVHHGHHHVAHHEVGLLLPQHVQCSFSIAGAEHAAELGLQGGLQKV